MASKHFLCNDRVLRIFVRGFLVDDSPRVANSFHDRCCWIGVSRGMPGNLGKSNCREQVAVVIHALRFQIWEMSKHGRSEAHAAFQFQRFVESAVRGDQDFDMLRENFGHERG